MPEAPGEIVPPPDGWYNTGDVVSIDEDGFIAIRGRMKRFAKIGGETVSLAVVENCAAALWPDNHHAAVALPDGRKGEQIVLVTDAAEARRMDLVAWAQNHGVSEPPCPVSPDNSGHSGAGHRQDRLCRGREAGAGANPAGLIWPRPVTIAENCAATANTYRRET